MLTKLLSDSEIFLLRLQKPWLFLPVIPDEGLYVTLDDSTHVYHYILVFKKTDGERVYVWTDSNPTTGDPGRAGYIISETAQAAVTAAQNLPASVQNLWLEIQPFLFAALIIFGAYVAYKYIHEIREIV